MSAAKKKKNRKKYKSNNNNANQNVNKNKNINSNKTVPNKVKKEDLPEEKAQENLNKNIKNESLENKTQKSKIQPKVKTKSESNVKENNKIEIKENTDEELNRKAEIAEKEKNKTQENKDTKKKNITSKKNTNQKSSNSQNVVSKSNNSKSTNLKNTNLKNTNSKNTKKTTSKIENKGKTKEPVTEKKSENKEVKENKKEQKELIKSPSKEISKTEEKPEYVQEMIKNSKKRKLIFICTIVLIILLVFVSTIVAISNLKNTNIMDGVKIKNIEVSNISKEEAKELIKTAMERELSIELDLNYGEDYKVTLKPEQIEFIYDLESVIEKAYLVGRDGSIVSNNYSIIFTSIFGRNLDIAYTYNGDLLNQFVEDINSKLPGVVVEPNYYIEDGKLIVNKGKDGLRVKKDDLKNEIIKAIISRNAFEITDGYEQIISIPVEEVKASTIDMKKIHSEIYSLPQNAYYELDPYKIYADVDGIDLTITPEEAQKTVQDENKEEYIFDLKITKAEKTINDLGTEAFPYLISTFSTKYDASNRNRSTNLEIAAQKINGKVLMPGEEFSFNKIVGKRTVEEGYKDAKIYADGGVVDGLAGGICQISSTLYNSVLLANLQITERRNHSFTTSYLPAGKDATVVWGTTDFRFINSRSYPIKIEASVNNGIAEFKIHGMKEEVEYEVKILPVKTMSIPYTTTYEEDPSLMPGQQIVKQSGHAGYKVTTYKELRQNGVVVSKEAISSDTYNPMRTIIRVAPGYIPGQQPAQ